MQIGVVASDRHTHDQTYYTLSHQFKTAHNDKNNALFFSIYNKRQL